MVGALEYIGCGLVDRRCPRTGRRIGLLARMQGQGVKAECFDCAHIILQGRPRQLTDWYRLKG